MQTIIIGGSTACGKTSLLTQLIPHLKKNGNPCVCKIDCLNSHDDVTLKQLQIPVIQGLSGNMCPDHFLATNILEIHSWGLSHNATHLFIETAGLCNRCAPFTRNTVSLCVIDAIASIKSPEKLGPLLTTADLVVTTKTDLISQAEREVLEAYLRNINTQASICAVNGLSGYGIQQLLKGLEVFTVRTKHTPTDNSSPMESCLPTMEGDELRYPMPTANCAYCVGETRIGRAYQQGIVHRMSIPKAGDSND